MASRDGRRSVGADIDLNGNMPVAQRVIVVGDHAGDDLAHFRPVPRAGQGVAGCGRKCNQN